MDPLSIAASATAIVTICLQTVRIIQKAIETIKNARSLLVKLLSHVERVRLLLEQLRSLTKQLGAKAGGLLLYFNDKETRATMRELKDLVTGIETSGSFVGLQVLMKKSKVEALCVRLKEHEGEIVTVLLSVATASAVRTEEEIKQMHEESKVQSEVLPLFEKPPPVYSAIGSSTRTQPSSLGPQIWWGDTYRERFDSEYLGLRDQLSDVAYHGDFTGIFKMLDTASHKYGEIWANAPSLHKTDTSKATGWTALHQMVFMGAPQEVVQKIIDFGALRTLRTTITDPAEFTHMDLTPLEIAQLHGHFHLVPLLSPVIRHPCPTPILLRLQHQFHKMIKEDLRGRHQSHNLRLPELEVLTELEVPECWFGLKEKNMDDIRGYLYRLDHRELVVKVYNIKDVEGEKLYRISENKTEEILDGVVFNTAPKKR